MNHKEIEDAVHSTRDNSSTTSTTTFFNDPLDQYNFRYSSDILSIGGSSHYSESSLVDPVSSNENALEEAYPWIDSVRSETFDDDEAAGIPTIRHM